MVEWITENYVNLTAIVGGLVTVASIIVKMTPTPKDDKALKKIVDLLNMIAINPKKTL